MNDSARYVYITVPRPHCPKCGASDLKVYKSMPMESDGSRSRYTVCRACGWRFIVVVETEQTDESFHAVENVLSHTGQ